METILAKLRNSKKGKRERNSGGETNEKEADLSPVSLSICYKDYTKHCLSTKRVFAILLLLLTLIRRSLQL